MGMSRLSRLFCAVNFIYLHFPLLLSLCVWYVDVNVGVGMAGAVEGG